MPQLATLRLLLSSANHPTSPFIISPLRPSFSSLSLLFSKTSQTLKPTSLFTAFSSSHSKKRRGHSRPPLNLTRRNNSSLTETGKRGKGLEMEETESVGFNKRRAEGTDNSDRPRKILPLKDRKLNPSNTICYVQMSSSRPNGQQLNNMYDPCSDDDDDVMDLYMISQITRDIPTRQPQRNCPYTGEQYIKFLLSGNPKSIREQLRMEVPTFVELVKQIVRSNVVDWSNMRLSLEESLAMFLFVCGQSSGTRNAGDRFQHSNETIHRHFVLMMRALGNLAPLVIQPPNMDVTHHKIRNDRRYWPWFKDCVGAIDGTHVVVVAPEGDQMAYRGRKVHTTQNVMAACSFDMKFTFVYTGWEGSAHDSRIFLEALTTNSADFPHPPPSKYYLVDAGYTHMPGYVAPYRGQKYHLQEFNRRRRYHGPQELFNHRHSSLRNVIERTFGVLKQRFPLLRHMPRYDMVRQGPIVMACCVLHNWIRSVQEHDEFFDAEESSDEGEDDVEDEDEDEDEADDSAEGEGRGEGPSQVQGEVGVPNVHRNEDGVPSTQQHNHVNMSREQILQMGQWRDEVAASMWAAYYNRV